MQKLHLVGVTTDQQGLILSTRRGARTGAYSLELDESVVAAVQAHVERLGAAAAAEEEERAAAASARPDSRLGVREIQAQLRRGRTVDEVAQAAGVDPTWVERFAAPVRAEQAQVVARVREMTLERARLGESSAPIGAAVAANLAKRGLVLSPDEIDAAWSAAQLAEGRWAVRFAYRYRARQHTLQFDLDEAAATVDAADRSSGQLGYVAPTGSKAKRAAAPTATPASRPRSSPARERRRAESAMTKAAAQRARDAERAAARRVREREAAQKQAERERAAAERAAAAAAAAKAKAAERAKAEKAAAAAKAKADKAKAATLAKATAKAKADKAKAERAAPAKEKRALGTTKAGAANKARPTSAAPKKSPTSSRKPTSKKAAAPKPTEGQGQAKKASVKKAPVKKAPVKKASVKKAPVTRPAPAQRPPAVRVPRPTPRPEPTAVDGSTEAPLSGAAVDVYGPSSARALFRAGLVEQVGDGASGAPAEPVPEGPRTNGSATDPQPPPPRRTRPLRAE